MPPAWGGKLVFDRLNSCTNVTPEIEQTLRAVLTPTRPNLVALNTMSVDKHIYEYVDIGNGRTAYFTVKKCAVVFKVRLLNVFNHPPGGVRNVT